MTWLDRIHVGDCRDLMRRMRDGVEASFRDIMVARGIEVGE